MTELDEALEALDRIEMRRYGLHYANVSAEWLGETADPAKTAPGRAEAMAFFEEEDHDALCGQELGEVLNIMEDHEGELDDLRRAQLRVLKRDRAVYDRVPAKLSATMARTSSAAMAAWRTAKEADDWASFAPHLDAIVATAKEMAAHIDPDKDPYDVWLDLHEDGCDRAFYDQFFETVRATVVPLVDAVCQAPQLSRQCVTGFFDSDSQWKLTHDLAFFEGVDPGKCLFGLTEHPFSDGIDSSHVFLATHIYEDDLLSNVFSVLHEGGHAMYEAGVDPAYDHTSLRGGVTMGMHEAQSRFFENYVGRSKAFAQPLLAILTSHYADKLAGVTPDELYQAENRVERSLVRTEADELTYPLHVMVRYEVEQALFDGTVTAEGVPELWNYLYQKYLGIEVPNDRRGALQDVHWSGAMLGYFPTYALGSAYGAQLLRAMTRDFEAQGTSFDGVLASGNLVPVRDWLREKVWRFGRAKSPAQIIEDATGEPFDPHYYTDYLQEKFSALYGLED